MPASLLATTVRPDEAEIARGHALAGARTWVSLQAAVGGLALLGLALPVFLPLWPALAPLLLLGWPALGWGLALLLRGRDWGERPAALPAAALVLLALVLSAVSLMLLPGLDRAAASPAFLAAQAAVLAAGVAALALLAHRAPRRAAFLGLRGRGLAYNLAAGLGAGAAIGFHALYVTRHIPGLALPVAPLPLLAWALAYNTALRAPGEELLFRGLAYQLAAGGGQPRLARLLLQIVPINLLIYLVYFTQVGDPAARAWALVYAGTVALAATLLRWQQDSLVPGLACNALAGTFAAAVIAL